MSGDPIFVQLVEPDGVHLAAQVEADEAPQFIRVLDPEEFEFWVRDDSVGAKGSQEPHYRRFVGLEFDLSASAQVRTVRRPK